MVKFNSIPIPIQYERERKKESLEREREREATSINEGFHCWWPYIKRVKRCWGFTSFEIKKTIIIISSKNISSLSLSIYHHHQLCIKFQFLERERERAIANCNGSRTAKLTGCDSPSPTHTEEPLHS